MNAKRVFLVLADISGYTRFVRHHQTATQHAHDIVSALLETVIDACQPTLIAHKLEGDAAFLYCDGGLNPAATAGEVRRILLQLFAAFSAEVRNLASAREGCPCDACCQIEQLHLKTIAHWGDAAVRQIRQFEELAGEDVILIHRLLKNSVPVREYSLWTEQFVQLCEIRGTDGLEWRTEQAEGIGAVRVGVDYPSRLSAA